MGQVGTLERGKSQHRPRNAPELLGGPYPLIQTGDVARADGGRPKLANLLGTRTETKQVMEGRGFVHNDCGEYCRISDSNV